MANQSKKVSTYMRLSEEALAEADEIAERLGVSRVAAFEEGIRTLGEVIDDGIEATRKRRRERQAAAKSTSRPAPAAPSKSEES